MKLKTGGVILLYLYYAFDNRPLWFRLLWKGSDLLRILICRMPFFVRNIVCQTIAAIVYWPLARIGNMLDKAHCLPSSWPLSSYRNRSFYVMRTDALDRFGTRLEQRFTRSQIQSMLEQLGFVDIKFSESAPYWCVIAYKS